MLHTLRSIVRRSNRYLKWIVKKRVRQTSCNIRFTREAAAREVKSEKVSGCNLMSSVGTSSLTIALPCASSSDPGTVHLFPQRRHRRATRDSDIRCQWLRSKQIQLGRRLSNRRGKMEDLVERQRDMEKFSAFAPTNMASRSRINTGRDYRSLSRN